MYFHIVNYITLLSILHTVRWFGLVWFLFFNRSRKTGDVSLYQLMIFSGSRILLWSVFWCYSILNHYFLINFSNNKRYRNLNNHFKKIILISRNIIAQSVGAVEFPNYTSARGYPPSTSALHMTINNLIVRFQ